MEIVFRNIKNIYFVGIGGIGMSALARYFRQKGYRVGGYDRTPSALTERLSLEGIAVNYRDEEEEIASEYRDKADTLVVYTPAVPADSRQLCWFKEAGFVLHKRSEVLGLLSRTGKALCVGGTHGKTTTMTLLAFLLNASHVGCNAFLGGISRNFSTNLLTDEKSEYIVVEADEFDRSFLQLTPYVAAITAMDEDHLDIYGNKANLIDAFEAFAARTVPEGKVFIKKGLSLEKSKVSGYYAVEEVTDNYSDNLRVEGVQYVFDYHGQKAEIKDLRLGVPGRMNVENATLAITIALEAGMRPEEIREALPRFKGVMRRFNIHSEGKVMYIDDYAHHPQEIEAVLRAVREMWPEKRLTVAFQPHLYSRTNDLQAGFAKSLDIADEVILLDIYPAREMPIPGVTSAVILDKLNVPAHIVAKGEFPKFVEQNVGEGIFMTVGAGDIDRFVPVFTDMFNK
ncbi:UDP-N-acetylmuramate--L-alanine ligase [uncultured Culturomica sp.]|jgi:UDP-N-acetylmuramate--alanine ligase|uniref:UDP-N-acetylmuramate--L-alanine ligase n=1 Tax=uncultured Culturomica sp. TaxID=1926654 RepID=UPI0003414B68|nr:UDP-N-acetylmuramate--L-alanine ligase [uncultured Culturomica sp.]CCZ09979.1 uDP-N-acetylmuramate--L-alanine ligase [Odoribacter sp. CAG:788]